MRPQRAKILSVAMLSLMTACGDPVAKMCESEVRSSLLNPETAEFFEFSDGTDADYRQADVAKSKKFFEDQTAWYDGRDDVIAGIVDKQVTAEMGSLVGAKYYRLRLKAEGKLGNKITSVMSCMVKDHDCTCLTLE